MYTLGINAAFHDQAACLVKDGRVLAADLLVMAVGIRLETTLARAAGLDCGRGVKVDDHLATSGDT